MAFSHICFFYFSVCLSFCIFLCIREVDDLNIQVTLISAMNLSIHRELCIFSALPPGWQFHGNSFGSHLFILNSFLEFYSLHHSLYQLIFHHSIDIIKTLCCFYFNLQTIPVSHIMILIFQNCSIFSASQIYCSLIRSVFSFIQIRAEYNCIHTTDNGFFCFYLFCSSFTGILCIFKLRNAIRKLSRCYRSKCHCPFPVWICKFQIPFFFCRFFCFIGKSNRKFPLPIIIFFILRQWCGCCRRCRSCCGRCFFRLFLTTCTQKTNTQKYNRKHHSF